MKSILAITLFLVSSILMMAQNKIELKDGYTIKKATLYRINENSIEYLKNGSLHDLLITEIKRIYKDDLIIEFDEDNKAVYFDKNLAPLKIEEPKKQNESGAVIKTAPDSSGTKLEQSLVEDQTISDIYYPDYAILLAIFSLYETDPNLKLTGEVLFGRYFAISQSAGLCFNNPLSIHRLLGVNDINRGYVLNTELKSYWKKQSKGNTREYFSFEMMYKNVSYKDIQYYSSGEYYDNKIEFEKKKTVLSPSFKIGKQITNKNIVVDMYVGIGFRFKKIKEYRLKNSIDYDSPNITKNDFTTNTYRETYPTLRAGIKIGFGGKY